MDKFSLNPLEMPLIDYSLCKNIFLVKSWFVNIIKNGKIPSRMKKEQNLSELLKRKDLVLVFNCAWHNPLGSKGRKALEESLKPNEVITDGMCDDCSKIMNAELDAQENPKPSI